MSEDLEKFLCDKSEGCKNFALEARKKALNADLNEKEAGLYAITEGAIFRSKEDTGVKLEPSQVVSGKKLVEYRSLKERVDKFYKKKK